MASANNVWKIGLITLMSCFAISTLNATPQLNRGVSLSHWFQYSGRQPVDARDLQLLHKAGFDHVRIPFAPELLGWDPVKGAYLPQQTQLRTGVELALAAGLDVVLDMHPDAKVRQAIEDDPKWADGLVVLWGVLAKQFSDLPADKLAFELLNEPQYYGWSDFRWNDMQQRLAASVRKSAQQHLILASGRKGSSLAAVTEIRLLNDANVAYVFHFYLPYVFSHQGAEWMQNDAYTSAAAFSGLIYPAQASSGVSPTWLVPGLKLRAERELSDYRKDNWNAGHIAQLMRPAAEWAHQHHVRLICNEFGVLRAHADADSRYRWLTDVRKVAEQNGFGWTVWDYTDLFGITAESGTHHVTEHHLESQALSALGLATP